MRRIRRNGVDVAYRVVGPENAPVVVLSHCLAADSRVWQPQIAALQRAFRVVTYDLRGHGQSSVPKPPYSIPELAQDVLSLLDSLSVERVHFVGLSLGGMIGQALAAQAPERVSSLVLCACASRVPTPQMWAERCGVVAKEGIEALIPSTLERWFSDAFRIGNAADVERIAAIIAETPAEGYIGCAQAIANADLTSLTRKITAPTLILLGEDDTGIALPLVQDMQANISGSRLVVIPGLRHHPNLEGADVINRHILSFLAEVEGCVSSPSNSEAS